MVQPSMAAFQVTSKSSWGCSCCTGRCISGDRQGLSEEWTRGLGETRRLNGKGSQAPSSSPAAQMESQATWGLSSLSSLRTQLPATACSTEGGLRFPPLQHLHQLLMPSSPGELLGVLITAHTPPS